VDELPAQGQPVISQVIQIEMTVDEFGNATFRIKDLKTLTRASVVDETKVPDDHVRCPTCRGKGYAPLVTSWDCAVCGREIDPESAWIADSPHRVRHPKGSPGCWRGQVDVHED